MKPKKLNKSYTTLEEIRGFYKSVIPEGTVIYPYNGNDCKPIMHGGRWHWRFVFDTMPNAKAHDEPKGNVRCAIWYSRGKFEDKIK